MALRTELFQQLPWDGGLNTRLDPALVPNNQLQSADNVVFATKGSRKTRNGLDFFDAIALASTQASSGTTRTIVFDRSLTGIISVGSDVSIFHSDFDANYDGKSFTVLTLTTTTNTDDTITYTHPLTFAEATTVAPTVKLGLNQDGISTIGLFDYFRNEGGGSKVRDLISIMSDGSVFEYDDSGLRTTITNSGAALTSITKTSFEQINEKLVIGFNSTGNTPKKIESSGGTRTMTDLGGSPPNFSIVSEHLSRLWTNDKTDPDRLHYSSTGKPEEWNGAGDSGAIDIGPGDGDPEGITAIFPTFKGELLVAKKNRLYQVSGLTPEDFIVRIISDGIGVESHNSIVPVDQDDMLYVSSRGFHSMSATANFGDFSAQFISADIQPTFQDFVSLENVQGVYIPTLNSICWAVNSGSTAGNSDLYFFNILLKEWYRWTDISCQAITNRLIGGKESLVIGTNEGRILEINEEKFSDFGNEAISVRIKTGINYPDSNPYTVKGFRKLILMFVPQGDTSFTAKVKIDNLDEQDVIFSQTGSFDALGTTFTLASSMLGVSNTLAPVTLPIDGFGHGATLEILKEDADEPIELFSYGYEYEPASTGQETGVEGDG